MAIKKSELYASLWASCDELRGGMDASQYKDYVLVLLFIKYVSDKYAGQPFAPITIPEGASFKDMVALKGKTDIGDQINKRIIGPLANANRLTDLPDFNHDEKLGSGKEKVDRLTNLIAIFENKALDFSKNRADGDDILGDAYEFLMRHFATESGKSKGQFYTPAEVSRVMAQIIGIGDAETSAATTVYDPTCGSGSLLLKVGAEATTPVTLNGQEKDASTSALARMNMILHDNPSALIEQGNTLTVPKFKAGDTLKTFDYVVANPPFSDKRWSTGLDPLNDPYERFQPFGAPPAKQGDYAYLLHIVRSLKSTGKGACILPHGVLFRGHAEATIRRSLVRRGYIKGIIGLPANLFYGTGIPACIIVVDKADATARRGIFMIDASRGLMKDGPKNRLRAQDIHKIVGTFTKQIATPGYSRAVSFEEIDRNDFNLNLPRYIDGTEPEDLHDIDGHLRGGIPERDIEALAPYWHAIDGVQTALFQSAGRPGYAQLKLPLDEVMPAIFGHASFTAFNESVTRLLAKWKETNVPKLKAFDRESLPKALIQTISEDLLDSFAHVPLLDQYDIYQHLMDYWAETMQDDCYLIAADGWVAETERVVEEVKSGKRKGQTKDKGWVCDLIPKPLIVARYFADRQAALTALEAELESVNASLDELADDHGGEDGALKDVSTKSDAALAYTQAFVALWNDMDKTVCGEYNDLVEFADNQASRLLALAEDYHLSPLKNSKGKLTLKTVKDRLTVAITLEERTALSSYLHTDEKRKGATKRAGELFGEAESVITSGLSEDPVAENYRDLDAVVRYLDLLLEQANLKASVKETEEALDLLAYEKYAGLTEDEIKTLVVDDKWLPTIEAAVQGELDRVAQTLTGRVRQLAERYATTLPQLTDEVAMLAARVDEHLKKMGAVWK